MKPTLGKIYSLTSAWQKDYVHAAGYGPFGDLVFLDRYPLVRRNREDFWKVNPKPPGLSIEGKGSEWPDVMFCADPPPEVFFSQTVIDSLVSAGIMPRQVIPAPVGSIQSAPMKKTEPPPYYVMEVDEGISVDYEASGYALDSGGKPLLPVGQPVVPILDPSTWTGLEIFRCSNWSRGGMAILCTERVKEIAEREKWSNTKFVPQRIKGINPFTGTPDPS